MKKTILLCLLFPLAMACSCTVEDAGKGDEGVDIVVPDGAGGTGETDGYRLVWADFFDDGVIDDSKWRIEVNGDGGGNAELQYYRSGNVSAGTDPDNGNGCLVLTAKKEDFGGKHFTSGRVNTSGKYEFTHGKVEASIRLPETSNGLWPAFWLLGADYFENGWPKCGEIDILEMGNAAGINAGTQDRYFNGACHWGYYINGNYPNYAKASTWKYSLQDGEYHLYTLVWDEDAVKMYVDLDRYPDSAPYYEMGLTDAEGDWAVSKYFHHDFFIIFNLAVGGYFTGILNADGITALEDGPASMYVDYVKVYQK